MRVLGLDPSLTAFGWALHETEAVGLARSPDRGKFKTSSKDVFVDRFASHREDVFKLIQKTNPDKVGIESPSFGSFQSITLNALFIQVQESVKRAKKDVVFFAPLQVKIAPCIFLNRPPGWKMAKIDMIEGARKHVAEPKKKSGRWTGDEADAYWVAYISGRFWKLQMGLIQESDLAPYESKMFLGIHTYVRGDKKGLTVKRGLLYKRDRYDLWSET